ncbi:MAG: hypothetical protein ACRDS0_20865 [Pseudonocardiaceae bacterium]
MNRFAAVRAGYGTLLLTVPDPVIRLYTGHRADPLTRAVTRVLGARHLIQGMLTGGAPGALVLALGVEVDLAHVASMLGLAALDRRRRRAGLIDAAAAGVFAVAGAILVWRTPATPHRGTGTRGVLTCLPRTVAGWTAQRTLPDVISRRLIGDQ